jgi:hypothetical protein
MGRFLCSVTNSFSIWEGLTLLVCYGTLPSLSYCSLHTGHLFPLEAHLVSVVSQATLPACPPDGCVVVTGVQFELSDDLDTGSAWLEPLFAAMPLSEGVGAHGMLALFQHPTCILLADPLLSDQVSAKDILALRLPAGCTCTACCLSASAAMSVYRMSVPHTFRRWRLHSGLEWLSRCTCDRGRGSQEALPAVLGSR